MSLKVISLTVHLRPREMRFDFDRFSFADMSNTRHYSGLDDSYSPATSHHMSRDRIHLTASHDRIPNDMDAHQ